jgi:hypothetical protein
MSGNYVKDDMLIVFELDVSEAETDELLAVHMAGRKWMDGLN